MVSQSANGASAGVTIVTMAEAQGREVYALLGEAERYGIGLVFEPDVDEQGNENGWTISYLIPDWPAAEGAAMYFPGDRLASAYDLETAVRAALKPLRQIGERYLRHLSRRAQ